MPNLMKTTIRVFESRLLSKLGSKLIKLITDFPIYSFKFFAFKNFLFLILDPFRM